jgi:RNA polymerase sigma-70 factor (ECF subfamily)
MIDKPRERAEKALSAHGNAILRMAWSYLHNIHDAEEILQETMIQFIRHEGAFESESHEKAWLLTVAANLSKNRIRYNKIRSADPIREELTAEDREDLAFIWEAVSMLPDKYSEVIHLYYQEGYSTAQTARILGIPEATVRVRMNRARKQLKEILKEAYDFEG